MTTFAEAAIDLALKRHGKGMGHWMSQEDIEAHRATMQRRPPPVRPPCAMPPPVSPLPPPIRPLPPPVRP